MKIVLVGASGDVGQAALAELSQRHDVVSVGRSTGDVKVDISDSGSIEAMYDEIGVFDALVSTAGSVCFAPLSEQTEASLKMGLENKVMGQINLVLSGLGRISDNGSFTLTSGVLDRDPVVWGTGAALANGALAGFATSAAIETPRGLRINVVSPGLLDVSEQRYGALFPGHERVSSDRVGRAFAKCVEGAITGQVVIVQ
ncbi:short chain dehydrogenase [uncultured Ruegeria sp.]|jgi:NAD(P)-dependent dehydrogenase (short-subunit alcohol dehydrogenase family)|uniref:short chain dehydrogenase n=1 Tax=uncultured Ruegeria sp. TaxID=259304 RepID=UPI002620B8AA|nr:short chain dehydrogenase [uncultured Ruegeria sp.]